MENEIPGSAISILMKYLQELQENELKKCNVLLEVYPVKEGYSNIPRALLENADYLKIAKQMIGHYQEDYALEITGNLLYEINKRDLLVQFKCDSQKYLDKNQTLWETRVKDHKKNYMEYIKGKFAFIEDNIRMGEYISLNNRYTKLLIIKEHRCQAEREHEIMSSGRKHLELMAQRAEHSYSSVAALFDTDEAGPVPRTVVLQVASGIGKTMTAQKIMLDWASGELFQGRFDYVFYINCRQINQLSGQQTIAELLSQSCPGMSLPVREIEAEPGKLLFIIDGFDELYSSIDPTASDPSKETQKDNIVMSLITKNILLKSYIIITTRPTALEKLRKCVVSPRFAEILGFSEDDRKEYFSRFFNSETQGAQAFNIVKGNDILFTMCFVPIVCWIVCSVIKQQLEENEDPVYTLRTTTSVYMSFLSSLLKQQSSDSVQPIQRNLQRLCALANEGVWHQKILFDEKEPVIPDVQSLFIKNGIFQRDTECETCYSFIHLSFQEFFAAMFYLLRENEDTAEHKVKPSTWLQKKCTPHGIINPRVITLLKASWKQKHLMLTVRFLFGLLNEETVKQMENRFQWKISPGIKPALLKWIKKGMEQDFSVINNAQMELFHCLYEIQEEEFVRSATGHLKHIGVSAVSLGREMTAMDFRALGFCLKNSHRVESVTISSEMKTEDLRALTPGLMTCSRLGLQSCSLTASCCAELCSLFRTKSSLRKLNLSRNELGDSGVRELCAGLKHPGCKIQTLEMKLCSLTASCCADLCSVLSTDTSLTELHLSGNELGAGAISLCEGLKYPECKIERLGLWGCSLTASCCTDLSSVLSTNTSLRFLNLGGNELGDSGVRELCTGLKHPGCSIQTLCLWGCSLTASCCADLCSVLSTNTSLSKLDLKGNKLGDSGVIALREGLEHPGCRIRKLDLRNAALTDACAEALYYALYMNNTLQRLEVSQNHFTWGSEAAAFLSSLAEHRGELYRSK